MRSSWKGQMRWGIACFLPPKCLSECVSVSGGSAGMWTLNPGRAADVLLHELMQNKTSAAQAVLIRRWHTAPSGSTAERSAEPGGCDKLYSHHLWFTLLWWNALHSALFNFFFFIRLIENIHLQCTVEKKNPKRILSFILFLCVLVSGGRCNAIR